MKRYLVFTLIVSSLPLLAAEPSVEITSFVYAGSRTRSAELCGAVKDVSKFPALVKVTVDEKSEKPGVYNVVVGPDSKFCVSVVTYTGNAVANVWGENFETAAAAKLEKMR